MKNDFYKKIIDEAPIGYAYHRIICDDVGLPCDFEYIKANLAFGKITGLNCGEIIGKKYTEVLPACGKKINYDWIKMFGEVALNGGEKEYEHCILSTNRWYKVTIFSPEKYYFIVYFFDITEQKSQAKEIDDLLETVKEKDNVLKSSQRQLLDIIEFLPDATLVVDKDRRIVIWNKAMEKMTGLSAAETVGKYEGEFTVHFYGEAREKLTDLVFNYQSQVQERYINFKREGDMVMGEAFCSALNNNQGGWIYAKAAPLYNQVGHIIGAVEIVRDITESKINEAALLSKAAFLEALTDATPSGILVVDENYAVTLINWRFIEIFNVSADILNYREDDSILLDYVANLTKDPGQFIARVKYLYEHINETSRDEIELKNGMILDRYSAPVFAKDGKFYGRIWTFHDITDRICMKEALEKEKTLLETTLLSVADGVISTDNQGRIVVFNKIAEAITGWSQDEALGKTKEEILAIVDGQTREKIEDIIGIVRESGKTIELSNHITRIPEKNREYYINYVFAPTKDYNGNITGMVITMRDMTEKALAQKLIKASEERFRAIFDQASIGIFLAALDRKVIDANQKACQLLGYSIEELRGMSFDTITYPGDLELTYQRHAEIMKNDAKTLTYEKRYIKKNGDVIWANISVSKLKEASGKPDYIITTIQDITDKKLAEIALEISEKRLRRAQEIAHVGNWELDPIKQRLWFSDEALRIHGIAADSPYLHPEKIRELIFAEDLPILATSDQIIMQDEKDNEVEFRIRRFNDGQERILHSKAVVEKDKDGNIKVLGVVKDITERKKAEEALCESEAKYKSLYLEYQKKQSLMSSLIDSIPDLIFHKDKDSVYMGCNRAFEAFAGAREEEIIGKTDYDLFDEEMAALFRSMDKEMMAQECSRKNEEIVAYPGGKKVFLETLKTPFYGPDGALLGLIGVSRDITERKKREEEILYLNYHDVLTGLYNRTYVEEMKKELNNEDNLPLSMIIGDINGLKLLNDALGHTEGDKLLIEMAKILKECSRPGDIVVRMGGDEFFFLLPKTSNKRAQAMIDKIKKTCEEYAEKNNKETYYTSISLGHATMKSMEESFDRVFKTAEQIMYRKKLLEYKSLHSSILSSIKTTLFEKSNETEEHAERLAKWSKKIGNALGLDDDKIDELELLSTLHDIGKISIDLDILTKPGELSEEEWIEIRKHPEVGYRIANAAPELRHIAEYILCHHEQWDGKGYPQGLKGEEIPLLARILAVVDSYDAMTQDRAYRKAIPVEAAIDDILQNAGSKFDPVIARIFVDMVLKNKRKY